MIQASLKYILPFNWEGKEMKKILLRLSIFSSVIAASQALLVIKASAHCPLCVLGAGAVATTATFLGVDDIVIGVSIGAFALALGLWISNVVKKKFIPY